MMAQRIFSEIAIKPAVKFVSYVEVLRSGKSKPRGVKSSSSVGRPALGQIHSLTANGLIVNSAVGQASINQAYNFIAQGIVCNNSVAQPSVGQTHSLTATGLQSSSSVNQPALSDDSLFNLFYTPIGDTEGEYTPLFEIEGVA